MKVYFNKPKDNWLSPYTIIEKVVFWREIEYSEPVIKFWANALGPFCDGLYKVRNYINRDIRYVKIDYWDVWSMDSTLSPIILPMLKQLKKVKHGAPYVDDEDVPPKLRSKAKTVGKASPDVHRIDDGVDKNFFKRFDYVLDEMIWTFTQLSMEDHEAPFYDHTESKKEKDLATSIRKIKVDREGLRKHNERIDNGLRLFGKYYRTLWD